MSLPSHRAFNLFFVCPTHSPPPPSPQFRFYYWDSHCLLPDHIKYFFSRNNKYLIFGLTFNWLQISDNFLIMKKWDQHGLTDCVQHMNDIFMTCCMLLWLNLTFKHPPCHRWNFSWFNRKLFNKHWKLCKDFCVFLPIIKIMYNRILSFIYRSISGMRGKSDKKSELPETYSKGKYSFSWYLILFRCSLYELIGDRSNTST